MYRTISSSLSNCSFLSFASHHLYLRIESAKTLADMDMIGYGIGGLSVGEPKPIMYEMLEAFMPWATSL